MLDIRMVSREGQPERQGLTVKYRRAFRGDRGCVVEELACWSDGRWIVKQ